MTIVTSAKTTAVSIKDSLVRNRTRIATGIAIVSTTIAVLQASGIANLNDFLEEKDLFDEYYGMNDFDTDDN